MEKLITKKNLSLFGIISFLLVVVLYFILQNNSKDDEKLFDIFLAELYNEQNSNLDEKLYYLSSLDNPKVSFFSDLKLTSIENLDRYNKIDKDIINNFTFNEIAKIYFYNLDINNFQFSESDRDNLNNFFIKAVDRLSNEKN